MAVLRKPLQDLLDAMDQVFEVMTNPEECFARDGGLIISPVAKFDIESEAQRFLCLKIHSRTDVFTVFHPLIYSGKKAHTVPDKKIGIIYSEAHFHADILS